MHKFTIFTVILSIITVSIVIDVVVNGYSLSNDFVPQHIETGNTVINENKLGDKTVTPNDSQNTPAEVTPAIDSTNNTINNTKEENDDTTISLFSFVEKKPITAELLAEIGVENAAIKVVPSDKLYLQAISLEENVKNSLKIVNLFDFEEYLGTIYGLHLRTLEEAEKLYSNLKAESLTLTGVEIRETNTFGDASFYLNQKGKTKTAFSVARIGSDVYGFEYPHSSHQMFKDLADKLAKNNE